ncbi:MAG: hypothetical protein ABIO49_03710 [Dokdonella sp.]
MLLATLRSVTITVATVFVGVPGLACAASRYAIESAVISHGVPAETASGRAPDVAGSSAATAPAASGYQLNGIFSGASDHIFSDGFDTYAAYDLAFPANTPIGGSLVLLGSINVPAGSYAAFVRLQVQTGSEADPGTSYRLICTLSPGFDAGDYRVGMQSNVERYLTFQGTTSLTGAGVIQFSCRDGNGHTDTGVSGKLTVISVGAVN